MTANKDETISRQSEPSVVANLVEKSHVISRCEIYHDEESNCVALITIDDDEAANMCDEQIHGLVEQAIAATNPYVSGSEQIKRWTISATAVSQDKESKAE